MARFVCVHTLPPNSMTREQIEQGSREAQRDPVVKGYRSFINLSEGKVACVLEAPDKTSVADWFRKMKIPYDCICPVELEGERGRIEECVAEPALV